VLVNSLTLFFSWLIAFLAQLNPLFGPEVPNDIAGHMRKVWDGFTEEDNYDKPCKHCSFLYCQGIHIKCASLCVCVCRLSQLVKVEK